MSATATTVQQRVTSPPPAKTTKVALLLSTHSFEAAYRDRFGLTRDAYLGSYRHDFSWDYVSGLAEQGVAASIYLPSVAEAGGYRTPEGVRVRFLPLAPWYRLWLVLPLLAKTPVGRYLAEVANARAFYGPLRRALLEDEISLLYVQEYWTGRFDFLAGRLELPLIAADHGGKSYRQLTWRKRRTFRAAYKLTAQTPSELAEVQRYGADAVLLTNGVDTGFYRPAPAPVPPAAPAASEKTILCVARLTEDQKRITDLIRALALLEPAWRLELAGSGPDRPLYEALVAELGLGGRVDFLGFVGDKEVLRGLYQTCGVFALTSVWEGLPLVVLEAMSCGAAVVVTDIRAFENLVEDRQNGVKVPAGDPEGIAAGILAAFRERTNLGRAARETVEARYAAKLVFRQLADLVKECVVKAGVAGDAHA